MARNVKKVLLMHNTFFKICYTITVSERRLPLPEISQFYGIVIKMLEGDLPKRAQELVTEWMQQHQAALLEMWETQNLHILPPL